MTEAALNQMVQTHGVWVIFLLTVVEGPVVTIIAGALAAKAVLGTPSSLLICLVGDVVGDCVLYGIGRGSPALTRRLVKTPVDMACVGLGRWRAVVLCRPWQILVFGKWTHAVGFAVILAAGAARLPFGLFLGVSALAAIPKVVLLFSVGYGFGQAVEVPWIFLCALIGGLGLGLFFLRRARAR